MKALIAYVIEFKYWSDLSILSYFWILLKPYAFYIAIYFIVSQSGYDTDKNLLVSLEWSIYWFAAVSCVQSCKKLRKFVLHAGFTLSDFIQYAMLDFVFNLLVLSIPVIILIGSIQPLFSTQFLYVALFYYASIPILIYIGVLSINAADFSYIFNFVPLIFIGLISHGWLEQTFIFSPFLAMAGRLYNFNHAIIMLLIVFAISMIVIWFLRDKFNVLYSEAIV